MHGSSTLIKDQQGNVVSFEQIYDRFFDAIFAYNLNRVGNVADAEDLTAQTFAKALQNLWRFRWIGGNLSAWLYRIATNEVNSYFRRGKTRGAAMESIHDEQTLAECADAERELSKQELFLELNRSIQRLPVEDQTLIVLRYLEGKSFAEIAQIMRKRKGTLTMRTHRALEKLKRYLGEQGIDHEGIRGWLETDHQTGLAGGTIQAKLTS